VVLVKAKAGIVVPAILIAGILAGIRFCLWSRKRMAKGPSLSGGVPPQFTVLRKDEIEAAEAKKHHIITGKHAATASPNDI
jgi:hypothetical protein